MIERIDDPSLIVYASHKFFFMKFVIETFDEGVKSDHMKKEHQSDGFIRWNKLLALQNGLLWKYLHNSKYVIPAKAGIQLITYTRSSSFCK